MVGLVLGEAEGEVLDVVRRAEFFEKQDELAQFFNEPVLVFSRGDGDEHHHIVGGGVEVVRVCEDDERWCECRVFREEACAVGVILIAEFCCRSIVVFGEIVLDVGEGCAEARVAYDRKVGRRLCGGSCGCCRCSLAAEDGFHTGEELVEVVECFHFLKFLLVFWELSSLIFSSRRCFWSRARAVSCTRSSYAFTSSSICLTRSGSRNQL